MRSTDPHAEVAESSGPRSTAQQQPWNRRRLLVGLRIFAGLSLAVVFVIFLRGNLRENFGALVMVSPFAIWIGLTQSVFDLCVGGLRLWFVARAFGAKVGLLECTRANGANIFIGGLTPSQTGGGPAQIYTLARSGAGFPVALVTSFVAYMGTIVSLLGFGVLMVWNGPPAAIHDGYGAFLRLGATLLGSLLLLILLALPKPGMYRTPLRRASNRIPWFGKRLASSEALAKIGYTLDTSSALLRTVRPRDALMILGGAVMTIAVYLNKFVVAYFVIRAMGFEVGLFEVIFLQWVLYLVLYFVPTPGASGVAELSAVAIMGSLIPSTHFGAFVVLWRVFSLYVPMALGGTLLLCRPSRSRNAQEASMNYDVEGNQCQPVSSSG